MASTDFNALDIFYRSSGPAVDLFPFLEACIQNQEAGHLLAWCSSTDLVALELRPLAGTATLPIAILHPAIPEVHRCSSDPALSDNFEAIVSPRRHPPVRLSVHPSVCLFDPPSVCPQVRCTYQSTGAHAAARPARRRARFAVAGPGVEPAGVAARTARAHNRRDCLRLDPVAARRAWLRRAGRQPALWPQGVQDGLSARCGQRLQDGGTQSQQACRGARLL
jgi:hypothetical protein